MRKRLTAHVALVAAGLVGGCFAVEFALRLSGYGRSFARADRTIGYVLEANFTRSLPSTDPGGNRFFLRTNNLGLRSDRPTAVVKSPHAMRVLVLGDSQSEGLVENRHTYAALLEQELRKIAPVEVLNAAVSGYSPLLSYLWWEKNGFPLAPDLVILALYAGNDLGEMLGEKQDFGGYGPAFWLPMLTEIGNGEWRIAAPGKSRGILARLDHILASHTRTWAALRAHWLRPTHDRLQSSPLMQVAQQYPGSLQAIWQPWFFRGSPDKEDRAWQQLRWVLKQLGQSVRAHGAKLCVVVIPTRLAVEPERAWPQAEQALAILGLSRPETEHWLARTHARFVAASDSAGGEVIDLLGPLRTARAEAEGDFYWDLDWHLSIAGHRAVARELLPRVKAWLNLGALPSNPSPGARNGKIESFCSDVCDPE